MLHCVRFNQSCFFTIDFACVFDPCVALFYLNALFNFFSPVLSITFIMLIFLCVPLCPCNSGFKRLFIKSVLGKVY